MGIIASPVSVAGVSLVAFLAKAPGGDRFDFVTLLSVTVPSPLLGVLAIGIFSWFRGKDLDKDEEFQARIADPETRKYVYGESKSLLGVTLTGSQWTAMWIFLGAIAVVAILGARQVGKTTLAREFSNRRRGPTARFDLEDPDDLARLEEPKLALGGLDGLVVLDEVQRRPDLFAVLRVLVDRPGSTARFLILGSASPDLLRQGSETLAGRIAFHELEGLALDETGPSTAPALWFRGGFPRSFLASSDADSAEWRASFVRTVRRLASVGWAVNTGMTRSRSRSACTSSTEAPDSRSSPTAAAIVSVAEPPRAWASRSLRRSTRTRSCSSARLTSLK